MIPVPVSPQYLKGPKDTDMTWSKCIYDWGNGSKVTLISTSKKNLLFQCTSIKDPIEESWAENLRK